VSAAVIENFRFPVIGSIAARTPLPDGARPGPVTQEIR
jgi:hypothetical protein